MEDDKKIEVTEVAGKTRRAFVKTAAQVAVTAPAVGLLLSASTKKAAAATIYGDDVNLGDNFVANDDAVDDVVTGDDLVTGDDGVVVP
jgi:hypothetical protein